MTNATIMPNGLQATGCLPRTTKLGSQFPVLERDLIAPIPREQWPELIAVNLSSRDLVAKIKGQTYGSCASHAACQCWEMCSNMRLGTHAWIELSPMSVYRHVNGGRDRGSTIGDNLRHMMDVGAIPVPGDRNREAMEIMDLDTSHVLGENDYRGVFPSGYKDTAKYFRFTEVFDIESFDGLITALLLEFPVEYGRSGHAITGVDPVEESRRYLIEYANSWRPTWGDQGFGRDTEQFVSSAIRNYGAYAVRTVYLDERLERYARLMAERATEGKQQ